MIAPLRPVRLVPAWKAYRTDVAENLAPVS